MNGDKRWATILGITVGVVGGVVAGVYIYKRAREGSEHPMRDAQQVIEQCYEKIEEIEATLGVLRVPTPSVAELTAT